MKRAMTNSNEKSDRNREMFNERQEGALVVQLAEKYGLSIPRVHRICMQEEIKVLKEENSMLQSALGNCMRKE